MYGRVTETISYQELPSNFLDDGIGELSVMNGRITLEKKLLISGK
jgi:hypothetical protein